MQAQLFEEILTQYEPLIKGQLKKLNLYRNHDHFYQVGVCALWEAYRKFEEGKGAFSAFALHTVRGHMLMELRRERVYDERFVLKDQQESTDFEVPASIVEYCDDPLEELESYIGQLSQRERLWVQEAIVYEKKLGQIALEQQVSKNTVATWRKTALKKLRLYVKRR
ncbi:sigma-70 family RNA polymerase sigma factor [Alkalihalophilus pseudofirmus]|uniref:Sigma-70 family RNA polymerase sigma factor n=1 Tax=Alkalihalophilus pseudofirmus TaxID=79885 RepID=A0AAJ2NPU8_ALKPS|nr:sigma-70 family RNA polymerase sigma factor [Alkalihalophilus pseudofirmus]MDV2886400.1 sigma-70 family RNA polymerase sigma factor [Alkalihalophilus pseudofirmus]